MIYRSHMYKTQIKDFGPLKADAPEPSLAEILQDYVRWVNSRQPPPPSGKEGGRGD